MGAILKGISVIKGVMPKSTALRKAKAEIAKSTGKTKKYYDDLEEFIEKKVEKTPSKEMKEEGKKSIEKLEKNKPKYPSGMLRDREPLEFIAESEYKKGGRVKKNKGGLMKGFPKIAMKGY